MSGEVKEKKQKNDSDGHATVTRSSVLDVLDKHTPAQPVATATTAAPGTTVSATQPGTVTYGPELNVVLVDDKILNTFPILQCWGCQALVWNCEVPPCAHLACHSCVDGLFRDGVASANCPICKESYSRTQWEPILETKHKVIFRLLQGLKIRCPEYQHVGCKDIIDYSEAKSHLQSTCKWAVSQCEFCNKKFKTCEMPRHGQTCKRWIKCQFCKQRYLSDLLANHDRSCAKKPIACPNNCGDKTQFHRESIVDHLRICPMELQPCPIPNCSKRTIPRKDLLQHLKDVKLHTDDLTRTSNTNSTSNAVIADVVKALCVSSEQLTSIYDHGRLFPVAFCDRMHVMRFAIAEVSEDLPLCIKCADELEPRQPHFVCDKCCIHHCCGCFARMALVEDGKSRNEHWAEAGLDPPFNELVPPRPQPPQPPQPPQQHHLAISTPGGVHMAPHHQMHPMMMQDRAAMALTRMLLATVLAPNRHHRIPPIRRTTHPPNPPNPPNDTNGNQSQPSSSHQRPSPPQ
jgi:hypothetical protein